MAISRAELLKELLPGLNELFGTEYENDRTTWAVYAECQQHDMTWKITKIIPWYERDGGDGNTWPPFKMTGCRDEIDAYKKFMEQTK